MASEPCQPVISLLSYRHEVRLYASYQSCINEFRAPFVVRYREQVTTGKSHVFFAQVDDSRVKMQFSKTLITIFGQTGILAWALLLPFHQGIAGEPSNGHGFLHAPGDIVNPGTPLNSRFNELFPWFSSDGNTIYFNSKRNGSQYYDIYYSTRGSSGEWGTPVPFTIMNSPYNDETPWISPDGNTFLFASDRGGSEESDPDVYHVIRVSYDIYVSHRINGSWSRPRRLKGAINTEDHERFPSLSPDQRTLYYTSWPFGNTKGMRIMEAKINASDEVSNAHAMGGGVNSGKGEAQLVVDTVHGGYRFMSRRSGNWDFYFLPFSTPVSDQPTPIPYNFPVNTPEDELGMSSLADGSLVFASNREGGEGGFDLYLFQQDALLKFHVKDETTGRDLSVRAKIIVQDLETNARIQKNRHIETYSADPSSIEKLADVNGRFSVSARPAVESVQVLIDEKGYLPYGEILDVDEIKHLNEKQILLRPVQKGAKFVTRAIHFDYNSASIRGESVAFLDTLLTFLKNNDSIHLRITGHTDLHGGHEYNEKLSLARAGAVGAYLIRHGIARKRLLLEGKGMREPLNNRMDPDADRENRRTEFEILNQ